MANTIILKRKSTTGAPTAGQLQQGELAINLLDEKLYSKNSSNAIFEITDHDNLTNFVADEHVAHSGVTITAGNGLTGGGTIAATRTLTLGTPGTLTAATTNAVTATSHTHDISTSGSGSILASSGATLTGQLNAADQLFIRPEIKDYAVTHTSATVSANAVTVDCTNGNSFFIDMDPATAAVTLTLSNPPATGNYGEVNLLIQMGTPAYGITWPGSVVWMGGAGAPTLTTTNDDYDLVHLFTVNGGITWFGTYATSTATGGGNVSNTGTPANDQIAVWTASAIIEGTSSLTFNGTQLAVTGTVDCDGVLFGSTVAASTTDLSKHISLYSTTYGINITSSNLNLVANSVNTLSSTGTTLTSKVNHDFSAGIDVTGNITVSGTVDGIDVANLHPTGMYSSTVKRNMVQYNRWAANQDMGGTSNWNEGIYGGYSTMTNGPSGMTYDPFLVMGSAGDVRSFLVVPRTASRGIAYKGSSGSGSTHTAWHYTGWTTTVGDADLSIYHKTATNLAGDVTGPVGATVVGNDSHTHAFNNLTGKTSGTGNYQTTGDMIADNFEATGLGPITTPGTDDLYIGGYGILGDRTGTIYVSNATGAVSLNYGGVHNVNTKLATTSTGISVTGNIVVTGTVDGKDVSTLTSNTGTVTAVNNGNGMNFTNITTSGTVTLGTPSTLTAATTNAVTASSHTHAITTTGSGNIMASNGATLTGAFNCADQNVDRAKLDDYSIVSGSATISANAATLTYSTAQAWQLDLEAATGNVTVTLSGGPPTGTYGEMIVKVQQDTTAARTITWAGGTFEWPGGTAPTMTATADAIDIYHFSTWNGGTNWWGSVIQDVK